jgi:DUF1680 family protein
MQTTLGTEFGGMNAVLTDLFLQTAGTRWLTVAKRFDHAAVFDPLAAGQDRLNGLHDTFTCCQGTGLETQTKLMDSIYFRNDTTDLRNDTTDLRNDTTGFRNDTTLIVSLFTPSVLNWTQRGITVTRTTTFPASDTTTLQVTGQVEGAWTMRIRIPGWTSGPTISVNGAKQQIDTEPGSYADLTRSWTPGDTVIVRLPMQVAVRASNDDANVSAATCGPVVLSGDYGNTPLSSLPTLSTTSITRTSSSDLTFSATANGSTVKLAPFYDAHGHNSTVYWNTGPLTARGGGQPPAGVRSADPHLLVAEFLPTDPGSFKIPCRSRHVGDDSMSSPASFG